jgi:hypothetical protein
MTHAHPTRCRGPQRLALALATVTVLALAAALAWPVAPVPVLGAAETPTATPACPRLVNTEGTPVAPADLGTPVVGIVCTETGIGTPVAFADLLLTLTAAQTKAGPVDLTVTLVDAAGQPVTDATVLVLNQHLEMNHGVSITVAVPTAPGRYRARQVPMGMGGHWQVEVQVTRPGRPPVAAVFVVTLSGPM